MLIKEEKDNDLNIFFDKAIFISILIYALGSMTSKTLISLGMGLACLLWLARIIITKDYKFKSTLLDGSIFFFVLSILISGIGVWSFSILINKFFFALLFYYVIVNEVDNLKTVKKLSLIVLISIIVASFYGLYQHYFLNYSRIRCHMSCSSFGSLLAIFMMFTISYFLWGDQDKYMKIGLLGLTLLFAVDLLFTKTRGSWLSFIGGIFSLGWLKDKKIIIICLLLFLIMAIFLPQEYINRFNSITNLHSDNSNMTRIGLWKTALLMLKDHPINGIGLGRFRETYEESYQLPNIGSFDSVHNNFLQFAAETGLIGLIAFSWLMLMILKILYQGYNNVKNNKWQIFILASFEGVIIFNLQGLTEFNFGGTESLHFFWFMIGLNTVILNQLGSKGRNKKD